MLLCSTNFVGYTNYPNNTVHKFYKQAFKSSLDVFVVLDSLNYINNLKLSIDANGRAGGFVECNLSYEGGV